MNILVTGGAGFIGSHLCQRLLGQGHEISIVDELNHYYDPRLKLANLEAIRATGPVDFVQADICDRPAIAALLERRRIEAIVHLAARAGVRPSLEDPLLYEHSNIRGTLTLLEEARRLHIGRFVFASSSSIYGIADRVPFREDDSANLPISPYAATKIAGEKLCFTYSHLYGIKAACLRFFTVYGPRQRPDLAINKFIRLIDEGKPVPMFGDGSSGRDFTFYEDTVTGIVAAMSIDSPFEVFNLGNSHPIKLRDMIAEIERAVGKSARIQPMPDQPGDVPITYADISKAQRMLGYRPLTPFSAGVARQVEWYRQQSRKP